MMEKLLEDFAQDGWWFVFGFGAQGCFGLRFIYQWFVSEKRGRSTIPLGFWFLSLAGGLSLFIYAIHRQEPVFVLGQGLGLVVYVRNLMLIFRRRTLQRLRHPQLVETVNSKPPGPSPAATKQALSP